MVMKMEPPIMAMSASVGNSNFQPSHAIESQPGVRTGLFLYKELQFTIRLIEFSNLIN